MVREGPPPACAALRRGLTEAQAQDGLLEALEAAMGAAVCADEPDGLALVRRALALLR